MNPSHFLYLHKDLTGVPDVSKVGKAITPYSAVRARQKFCWQQFSLDHLWIGLPNHISWLEETIKHDFRFFSGHHLQNMGTQTEIFQVNIRVMRDAINQLIKDHNLCVEEVLLDKPYTATSSGQCPFHIPSEKQAAAWLDAKMQERWPEQWHRRHETVGPSLPMYNHFFDPC